MDEIVIICRDESSCSNIDELLHSFIHFAKKYHVIPKYHLI